MGGLFSHFLYFSEKFSMCLSALLLILCLVVTLLAMLLVGIGLGYNYCYVGNKNKTKTRYSLTQDRPQYPGYGKHHNITLFPRHRTRKTTTGGVQKRQRYFSSDRSGLTRGPSLENPWNHEVSADRVAASATIVDTENIDDIEYNTRKQYAQNRQVNIKLTNTSNENQKNLQLQTTNMKNKDNMVARFKQYDEIDSKMLEFLQSNDYETNTLGKHGMTLYPIRPSENGYNSTYLKYLKLKTTEKLPAHEDTEYNNNVAVTVTSKNSDFKITDNKKMLTISGLDLMAVLSQLRAENRNYSLQILV
ncbi:uncharacterized protein LOC113235932 [Hyposmocoma kahamanoa]|uniref:uncharacterized protein LOC113235932 n=1 Tax=Hyposmocoma kahamanoa TaxID=1477025 RepID=UPI000E6D74A3|nr:uncharacterized protein LOC113235932 [Hyposmocoma kahamanoa]